MERTDQPTGQPRPTPVTEDADATVDELHKRADEDHQGQSSHGTDHRVDGLGI